MPNLSSSIVLKNPKRKPRENPNTTTTYLGYTLKPSSSWRTHAIQPLGNLLLLDHSPFNSRDTGLGSLRVLPDPLLLDLLAFLSASDLVTLSLVSRASYVFATHDPLWRPLVLDRWPLPGPFLFDGSWRRCFGQLRKKYRDFEGIEDKDNAFERSSLGNSGSRQCLGKEDRDFEGIKDNDDALGRCSRERDRDIGRNSCLRKKKRKFHQQNSCRDCKVVIPSGGLRIRDFYSDYLFQSWLCANIEMKLEWLEIDNIQRRRGISVAEFVSDFEEPNRPVLLEGCISHWPAMEKWDRERLIGVSEDVTFAVGPVEMRLEDYFRYADAACEERPLYLFDPRFAEKVPELGSDYEVPEYFRDDLFSVLGSERPDYRWIIIGPTGSGSSFHVDPNSTSAWNAIVRGAKKWVMFPPEVVPPGVYPSKDGADVACPVSIIEWFMNFYGACTESRRRPVECICRAGEVVFVPNGWWHLVINLEDSIAITQNYVSRRNLLNVLDFLNRPNASELVSGTTDRVNLYDKFKNAIELSFPGTIDQLRQKAQEKLEQKRKPTFWESVTDANVGGFKFSF